MWDGGKHNSANVLYVPNKVCVFPDENVKAGEKPSQKLNTLKLTHKQKMQNEYNMALGYLYNSSITIQRSWSNFEKNSDANIE